MSSTGDDEHQPLLSRRHTPVTSLQASSTYREDTTSISINNDDNQTSFNSYTDSEIGPLARDANRAGGTNASNNGTGQEDGATSAEPEGPPALELLSITSGAFLGAFLCALDGTLVATLSASISSSFSNMKLLGWLASAFFIAAAASQPIAGKLTDVFGRRPVLLFASAIFGLGNITCAFAQREWQLLLGRWVAGLGGGAIYPVVTIILTDLVPLRRRGVWQGIGNICFTVGSSIGGPFGGWIADALTWRWAFAIQTPVTVVSMVLIVWRLDLPSDRKEYEPGERRAKLKRIDFLGAVLSVLCVVLLLTGLSSGGTLLPWNHPLVLVALTGSVIALAVFVAYEYTIAQDPIIPVALIWNRTIAAVYITNWFHPMARFGLQFYAPIYFQVQGYSAGQTGLRFLPDSFAVGIGAVGSGILMRITGKYYALSVSQQLLLPISIVLFSTLRLSTPAWPPFVYLFFTGLGFSGMLTTTLIALLATVEQTHMAAMTSALFVFRSTGSVIGISAASAVYQNILQRQLHDRLGHLPNGDKLIREVQQSLSRMFELPVALRTTVQEAYMESLRTVYLMLAGFAVVGVLSATLIKERPLPTKLSR